MRVLGAVLLLAMAPATGFAGVVQGSVALGAADLAIHGAMASNPYVGQLSGASMPAAHAAATDTIYGVAWIDEPAPGDAGPPPPPVRMDQLGQKFVPRVLAIVAGQQVEFHNSDNVYHNIFSYSPPKKFDLGRYPKGKSRSVTFVKAGAVQVYCDIHSDMRGDIIVAPSRRFALIGPSGAFRIPDVGPGQHRLKVWIPSGERTAAVTVAAAGVSIVPPIAP